jgi:hypothetical protein
MVRNRGGSRRLRLLEPGRCEWFPQPLAGAQLPAIHLRFLASAN